MPILNYTTSISAEKTAGEIQKKLAAAKAQAVLSEYDDNAIMSAMSFRIMTPHGMILFRLPANTDGVYQSLVSSEGIRPKFKTKEQAARVAWRILKDWVEAQLAIVDAEMADMTEVFLPYAQDSHGKTVYQNLKQGEFKMLTQGTRE